MCGSTSVCHNCRAPDKTVCHLVNKKSFYHDINNIAMIFCTCSINTFLTPIVEYFSSLVLITFQNATEFVLNN